MEIVSKGTYTDKYTGYIKCPKCGTIMKIDGRDFKLLDVEGIRKNEENERYNDNHYLDDYFTEKPVNENVLGYSTYRIHKKEMGAMGVSGARAFMECGFCGKGFMFDPDDYRPVVYSHTANEKAHKFSIFKSSVDYYKKLYPKWNKKTGKFDS